MPPFEYVDIWYQLPTIFCSGNISKFSLALEPPLRRLPQYITPHTTGPRYYILEIPVQQMELADRTGQGGSTDKERKKVRGRHSLMCFGGPLL